MGYGFHSGLQFQKLENARKSLSSALAREIVALALAGDLAKIANSFVNATVPNERKKIISVMRQQHCLLCHVLVYYIGGFD